MAALEKYLMGKALEKNFLSFKRKLSENQLKAKWIFADAVYFFYLSGVHSLSPGSPLPLNDEYTMDIRYT